MSNKNQVASTVNYKEVADELLRRNNQDHRKAETEAWKLRAAHGLQSPEGMVMAAAAFEIADRFHQQSKKRDINNISMYNVPVFGYGPNSSRKE